LVVRQDRTCVDEERGVEPVVLQDGDQVDLIGVAIVPFDRDDRLWRGGDTWLRGAPNATVVVARKAAITRCEA